MEQIAKAFVVCPDRRSRSYQLANITLFFAFHFICVNEWRREYSTTCLFCNKHLACMGQSSFVPFHKGNGTGGTHGTRLVNVFLGYIPNRVRSSWVSCSTCSACFTHSAKRNGTKTAAPHTSGTAVLGVMTVNFPVILRNIRRFCWNLCILSGRRRPASWCSV